jgi:SAM-dependent methyltransferase
VRTAPRWQGARVGIARLLVPLDPWRYYEMGRLAEQDWSGRCLDVSSPKLLMSLLEHQGRGTWIGIDLFEDEIGHWQFVDPALDLSVQDATDLPFADGTFDRCLCVSVVEHIPGEGDSDAMAEMFRVIAPGGVLDLTTEVSRDGGDRFIGERLYGDASTETERGVFFGRRYTGEGLRSRLLQKPWEVLHEEYVRQRDPGIEERFYRRAPWSYLYGGLLRRTCAANFESVPSPAALSGDETGVAWLRLRKPRVS